MRRTVRATKTLFPFVRLAHAAQPATRKIYAKNALIELAEEFRALGKALGAQHQKRSLCDLPRDRGRKNQIEGRSPKPSACLQLNKLLSTTTITCCRAAYLGRIFSPYRPAMPRRPLRPNWKRGTEPRASGYRVVTRHQWRDDKCGKFFRLQPLAACCSRRQWCALHKARRRIARQGSVCRTRARLKVSREPRAMLLANACKRREASRVSRALPATLRDSRTRPPVNLARAAVLVRPAELSFRPPGSATGSRS
jgi:hypothetical protein